MALYSRLPSTHKAHDALVDEAQVAYPIIVSHIYADVSNPFDLSR